MRNIILLTVLISLLFGCTSQEEKKRQEEEKYFQQQVDEKIRIIDNLTTKFNIHYKWDTLNYDFSLDYNPVIKTKYQLIDDIEVINIYSKDSSEYISIKSGIDRAFYFDFPITKEQETKFLNESDLILIVSISDLNKIQFEFTGEVEASDYAKVNLDLSNDFIGRGNIIKIISINNSLYYWNREVH